MDEQSKIFFLDEDSFFAEENDKRINFDSTYEQRFNTLISLFSMKNGWKSEECLNPTYEVVFEDKDNIDSFSFCEEMQSNWFFFNSYIANLMGDYYG